MKDYTNGFFFIFCRKLQLLLSIKNAETQDLSQLLEELNEGTLFLTDSDTKDSKDFKKDFFKKFEKVSNKWCAKNRHKTNLCMLDAMLSGYEKV